MRPIFQGQSPETCFKLEDAATANTLPAPQPGAVQTPRPMMMKMMIKMMMMIIIIIIMKHERSKR